MRKIWPLKGTGFRVCVRTPVRNSVPKGRLRVAQHVVLGRAWKLRPVPQGRLRLPRTRVLGLHGLWRMGKDTQDLLSWVIFSRPWRDWSVLSYPTQHCVLGYSQPSLRD